MAIHIGEFVAYYRLNKNETDIADQQKAVQDFLNGGNWKIIYEFYYKCFSKKVAETCSLSSQAKNLKFSHII